MDSSIYRLVSFGIFVICCNEFGSALRVVQKPQPFTFSAQELNISCIADDPSYMTKSILSIQIMRHIEDKAIAIISVGEKLKTTVGIKDNVKAKGHIDTKSKKGYLSLIIDRPHREDAGTYRCQMFVVDEDFQVVEKNVIGNVTYQESDITGVVTHLARKLTSLLTRFNKQNNTLQTLQKQHTTFKHFHSGQKLDMDNMIDQIDTQNITITEQNKQQNLGIDNLNDEMDRQKSTNMKQAKQIENQNTEIKKQNTEIKKQDIEIKKQEIEIKKQDTEIKKQEIEIKKQDTEIKKQDTQIDKQTKQIERLNGLVDKLNTDNTQKQQQLDTLLDYIQSQNKTNREHEIQLEKLNNRVFLIDWTYYQADKTLIKVFGEDDTNKRLSWTKARGVCQSFGGDLVVIRDAQKIFFVNNLFGGKSYVTWIGVRNNARRGFDFKYVDGSDMGSYHPWGGSEPDGDADNGVKCVDLHTVPSYPGHWDDDDCSNKYSYVCSVSSTND